MRKKKYDADEIIKIIFAGIFVCFGIFFYICTPLEPFDNTAVFASIGATVSITAVAYYAIDFLDKWSEDDFKKCWKEIEEYEQEVNNEL